MTKDSNDLRLTAADVQRLMSDDSADARIETSSKIAAQYDSPTLTDEERKIAQEIFRLLVKDAEVRVREALSTHLKASKSLPRDVAVALANDVDSVALPVLKVSEVLTDADLIAIIRGKSPSKQTAIAQRSSVSSQVSDALVDDGNEEAVARLLGNEGAELSESTLGRVMDSYPDSVAVADSIVRRTDLPPAISERVVAALSEQLHTVLVAKHDVSPDVATNLILQVRERALMGLLDYGSSDAELDALVDQLYRKGRLTPSLLLRALCVGDINLFERAMARMTGLPLQNVRILIHDKGMLGLEPLYMRAQLPPPLFPAFRAAIALVVETDYDGGANDRERFVERMLARVLTQFPDPSNKINSSDIEFLLSKLQQIAA
jgi:uncharacterized protein (DUF2336 family)